METEVPVSGKRAMVRRRLIWPNVERGRALALDVTGLKITRELEQAFDNGTTVSNVHLPSIFPH